MSFKPDSQPVTPQAHQEFKLGIENLSDLFLKNLSPQGTLSYRVGLITNQTGTDQHGKKSVDILWEKGLNVQAILSPDVLAENAFYENPAKTHKVPIVALYSKTVPKHINYDAIKNVDVLVYDMQDIGMRHFSYVTSLLEVMQLAAAYDKKVVVLDRPNLLGDCMEGPLLQSPELKSALAPAAVPIRYGMTIGELSRYLNSAVMEKPADLHVVQMKDYQRSLVAHEKLMTQLSPNITNIHAAYGYSFLGLLGEVTPFDVGLGTEKAFQCVMLPEKAKFSKQKWHELRIMLKRYGVDSKFYQYYSQRKKQNCSGLQLFITDINNFSAFNTLLSVLDFFKRSGVKLTFSKTFDKVLGTNKVREFVLGNIDRQALEQEINGSLQQFYKQAVSAFIYRPLPKVVGV